MARTVPARGNHAAALKERGLPAGVKIAAWMSVGRCLWVP